MPNLLDLEQLPGINKGQAEKDGRQHKHIHFSSEIYIYNI